MTAEIPPKNTDSASGPDPEPTSIDDVVLRVPTEHIALFVWIGLYIPVAIATIVWGIPDLIALTLVALMLANSIVSFVSLWVLGRRPRVVFLLSDEPQ